MGELGRRFREYMVARGFAPATKESYEYAMVDLFRAYDNVSPDLLTCDQVQSHVARLAGERQLAWSTVNVHVSAFRCFYTHRVAISDHRIRRLADGTVTFTWRDRADGNREKTLTIPVSDFIGRFLLHVLPRGFQKVRAYGWLAPRHKAASLTAIRAHLGATTPTPPPADETAPERILRLTGVDVTRCPVCETGHLIFVGPLPRSRDGPP